MLALLWQSLHLHPFKTSGKTPNSSSGSFSSIGPLSGCLFCRLFLLSSLGAPSSSNSTAPSAHRDSVTDGSPPLPSQQRSLQTPFQKGLGGYLGVTCLGELTVQLSFDLWESRTGNDWEEELREQRYGAQWGDHHCPTFCTIPQLDHTFSETSSPTTKMRCLIHKRSR